MDKKRKNEYDEVIENIIEKNMIEIMSDSFSRFSKYVIQQRAIPDVRDGLKPVQRRILFSMWNLKLRNKDPFKKSARIVGDVLGKYHPHGDSSVYEAMVRMAQEWKSNYPLVQMHGNKGSIDDDPAAAMRYTESRLEKITELMLKDLERKVVTMVPNFDDSEYEPVILPTLFPNLLVNGALGIASGFATQIPPHNLGELIDALIAMIKKPNISVDELMNYVKGPDFPTGGIIYGTKGIIDAFKTGRGKITLSSKYKFIEDKKGNIVGIEITEIPFGVIKSKMVFEIDSIISSKTISGIKEIRDQSDRNGLSIYIELEENSNSEAILTYLMNKTKLRINYDYNMLAIYKNAPCLLSLDQALFSFLEHSRLINTNGIKFDLQRYKLRHEIVEGFIRVAEISDEVVKLIKESDNSKKGVILALMKRFNFSEIQATAIAELRLYKLSRMDQIEFQEEKRGLETQIQWCEKLLNDSFEFDKFLISQLSEIKNEYAKERKTIISEELISKEVDHKLLTKNEDFYFFVSEEGYIKKISNKTFNSNDLKTYKLKENDTIRYYDKINSLSKLIFFTNKGNFFVIEAHNLKDNSWKELGTHVSSIVNLESQEKVIRIMEITSYNSYINLILISKYGYGKKVKISNFDSKIFNKKRMCINFKNEDDELIDVKIGNDEKDIFILLNNGSYFLLNENIFTTDLALRAQGIKILPKLQTKEKTFVSAFTTCSKLNNVTMLTEGGMCKQWKMADIEYTNRTNRGTKLFSFLRDVSCIPKSLEVNTKELELLITNKDNETERIYLDKLLKDKSKKDKLIRLEQNFNNSGYLIQHIKINELIDVDNQEKEKLKKFYLEQKELENNLELTTETSLFKRYYHSELPNISDDENDISLKIEDNDQIQLFETNDDFVEIKNQEINKPKSKINLTFEEKLKALDNINLDLIEEKVKQIKKK
ncbi:DNA topoisomerase (ATP-hydrolyzing) [Mycoplasmopsis arginini]|uniref:DNA topoisomerase (ATP-hydrolyzing) n=2 Tax=Mycoplasmopsis arginini TaxID=2094 RepID=A0AA43QZ00_MYCAR|nr:DNA topoisomerase (ATP-hydrolyzing) [Mycoplasmopsis arginini]MDI3348574.1 DNA topoisomerase 4 subunit A [Mycoplasmopsis arginini]MDI3349811.1 DNA topoisomerase 4 subunit A [Mycoplasmopsis arginini]